MVKQEAWKWIDEHKEEFIEVSDKIWGYAEYGLCEDKSSKLIAEKLREHGFRVQHGVAGMPTAILAEWGEGKPIIACQGEYDALPGISNKVVPRKEALVEKGMGHGCGHNVHGTTALTAVIAVKQAMKKGNLKGTVRFYGTPAEENFGGKVFMVLRGLYDDVDAVFGHHPMSMNVAGLSSSNATNAVKFHYYGKTAHAAGNPEMGRSALDAIELMNIGVNYLREHVIQEARIHYVIEEGGGQPNVVPDYARSWYYIRAPRRDQVDPIFERIVKIAEGAALMTETELKVDHSGGLYNLIPNRPLAEVVTANMREVGPPTYSKEELAFAAEIAKSFPKEHRVAGLRKMKVPNWEKYVDVDIMTDILDPLGDGETMAGSTDVADVSWVTPAIEFASACNVLGAPGHSWQFVACSGSSLGHKSLIFAAKAMAGSVLDLMTNSKLREEVKEEHKKRLGGQVYKPVGDPDRKPPLEMARETAENLKGKQ
ncbi:MAG: amidohydrolase [Candidatus Bathyarchaeota archaeon]|nr:amidohydrolase [Candidatus Bathyarchaeota archaeon]